MCGVWYKQLLGNYSCHDQTNFVLQEMEAFFMKYANCIHWRQGCHMSSNAAIAIPLISTQWHFFYFFASGFRHAKSQQLYLYMNPTQNDREVTGHYTSCITTLQVQNLFLYNTDRCQTETEANTRLGHI